MFQKAVEKVLKAEGGYVNHPDDRGGATNFGITEQTLAQYRGVPVSDEDVKNMSRGEAINIYEKFYWNPLSLGQVQKQKLAMIIFDQAVNKGIGTAARTIQKILGLKVDGKVGPVTVDAINNYEDETKLCLKFVQEAQIEYVQIVKRNPSQIVFLEGWMRRTHELLEVALS